MNYSRSMTDAWKRGYRQGQKDGLVGIKQDNLLQGRGYFETAAECDYALGYTQGWRDVQ